jgi:hypothetical protein
LPPGKRAKTNRFKSIPGVQPLVEFGDSQDQGLRLLRIAGGEYQADGSAL